MKEKFLLVSHEADVLNFSSQRKKGKNRIEIYQSPSVQISSINYH